MSIVGMNLMQAKKNLSVKMKLMLNVNLVVRSLRF